MMNVQPHGIPMGEQFFTQNGPQEMHQPMNVPQMFSSQQVNQSQMLQQQQPGMMSNAPGLQKQDITNSFLSNNQKMDPLVMQQQQQQQQQLSLIHI